jgi:hypothetical protein
MRRMKLFIDTHSAETGTFPAGLARDAFDAVFAKYADACEEEGVVIVNSLVNAGQGRMFCLNLAPDAEAIRRAHDKVGLVFDSITEVSTASPGDIYFDWK